MITVKRSLKNPLVSYIVVIFAVFLVIINFMVKRMFRWLPVKYVGKLLKDITVIYGVVDILFAAKFVEIKPTFVNLKKYVKYVTKVFLCILAWLTGFPRVVDLAF